MIVAIKTIAMSQFNNKNNNKNPLYRTNCGFCSLVFIIDTFLNFVCPSLQYHLLHAEAECAFCIPLQRVIKYIFSILLYFQSVIFAV